MWMYECGCKQDLKLEKIREKMNKEIYIVKNSGTWKNMYDKKYRETRPMWKQNHRIKKYTKQIVLFLQLNKN
jgi:hypothetical protein